jgi:hypothetical protein
VTKDDARDAQRAEAQIYGGQNPRGGMAAQMQVSGSCSAYIEVVSLGLEANGSRVRQISWRMPNKIARRLVVCKKTVILKVDYVPIEYQSA